MIAVYLWELMRRKAFTFWWTIGVTGLISLTILSYLSIKNKADEFNQAFDSITASAGSFLGGTDFFSPVGYLSSQIYYILLPLLLIIMTMTLVSSLMSKDENDRTVELTLARSISRRQLLLAKALSGMTIVGFIAAISYAVTVITVAIAGIDINQGNLLLTHILCFAFSASFGVIGFALIAMSRQTRRAAGIVVIVISFGGYVITSLAGFVDGLRGLAKALPYHYYNTADLLEGTVDKGLIIYLLAILVIGIIVSIVGYNRRDIG